MLNSILLPLDGSAFSETALEAAVDLARRSDAELHVVHVREPVPFPAMEAAGEIIATNMSLMDSAHRTYLDHMLERIERMLGRPVTSALLEPPVADALATYVSDHDIDLIVMATHGRSGIVRYVLGSVAAGLVARADTRFLLVRPERRNADANVLLTHAPILLPLDGTTQSEIAIPRAIELANMLESTIVLTRVVAPAYMLGPESAGIVMLEDPDETERRRAEAASYLTRVADRMRGEVERPRTLVVVDPAPANGIVRAARSESVRAVVLATHARRGLKRLVLGSVSERVLSASPAPVLLTRIHENAETRRAQPAAAGHGIH